MSQLGNLDTKSSSEVIQLLKKANKEYGQTIIMITHNLKIAKMADRIIQIKNGKVSSMEVNEHPVPVETIEW